MYSFLVWTLLLVICGCQCVQGGQYEDVRCKCICPSVTPTNTSSSSRKLFVKSFSEPSLCKCINVVDQDVQDSQTNFCERCDCQWQRRNTTTIKVVVIFIICVVALLFLYMLFLLCLDPLMAYKQSAYVEQRNEASVAAEARPVGAAPRTAAEPEVSPAIQPGMMSRVRHKMRNMAGEQERWKGTVQEQRRNIYDRHTLLN